MRRCSSCLPMKIAVCFFLFVLAVLPSSAQNRAAYFNKGNRTQPLAAVGIIKLSAKAADSAGEVWIDGWKAGVLPFNGRMTEGNYQIQIRWSDKYAKNSTLSISLETGATVSLVISKIFLYGVDNHAVHTQI